MAITQFLDLNGLATFKEELDKLILVKDTENSNQIKIDSIYQKANVGSTDITQGTTLNKALGQLAKAIDVNAEAITNLSSASDDKFALVSHEHGNITNGGAITESTAVATGDAFVMVDASDESHLIRTNISLGASSGAVLKNDGTWVNVVNTVSVSSPTAGNVQLTITDGKETTSHSVGINGWDDKADLASPAFTGVPTAPTAAEGTNTTQIATTEFVTKAVATGVSSYFVFKGTIASSTDIPSDPKVGWAYRVTTGGTYAGEICEAGDMLICVSDDPVTWSVVQNNIDIANITAARLASDAGDETHAVYIKDGVAVQVDKVAAAAQADNAGTVNSLTVETAVPPNAVFTDVSVTEVGNHYTPIGTAYYGSSVTVTGTTDLGNNATGVQVITGVHHDAAGHITAIVTDTLTATNSCYTGADGISISDAGVVGHEETYFTDVTNVGSSANVTPDYGETFTIPQFVVDKYGHVTSTGSHTVKIPESDNTDTTVTAVENHYVPTSTGVYGASATVETTTDLTVDSNEVVVVTGLAKDAAGHITGIFTNKITATNSIYDTFTPASTLAAGEKGLVPAPAAGQNEHYLTGAGTWVEITAIPTLDIQALFNGGTTPPGGGDEGGESPVNPNPGADESSLEAPRFASPTPNQVHTNSSVDVVLE